MEPFAVEMGSLDGHATQCSSHCARMGGGGARAIAQHREERLALVLGRRTVY